MASWGWPAAHNTCAQKSSACKVPLTNMSIFNLPKHLPVLWMHEIHLMWNDKESNFNKPWQLPSKMHGRYPGIGLWFAVLLVQVALGLSVIVVLIELWNTHRMYFAYQIHWASSNTLLWCVQDKIIRIREFPHFLQFWVETACRYLSSLFKTSFATFVACLRLIVVSHTMHRPAPHLHPCKKEVLSEPTSKTYRKTDRSNRQRPSYVQIPISTPARSMLMYFTTLDDPSQNIFHLKLILQQPSSESKNITTSAQIWLKKTADSGNMLKYKTLLPSLKAQKAPWFLTFKHYSQLSGIWTQGQPTGLE